MPQPATLPDLVGRLRRGELSVSESLETALDRVRAVDPEVLSLIVEGQRETRLRREAAALEVRHPDPVSRPPLFGALIGVKDIFRVDGFPTRAGSKLPLEALAGNPSEAVRRLVQAGALVLGKTVTTEFAYFAPGPTRNPRNLAHTPGGSSSGSAAAVAAGLAPLALGTQTIGSVLRPASFCGVVGFKPTYGRIPVDGVIPLAPSLDHVGFFTTDVSGAGLAASVLCDGWKQGTEASLPILGVPVGPYLDRAGPIALRHFDRALERLEAAGFEVRRVRAMPDFEQIVERHQVILAAEAASVHADWFERFGDLYHQRTAELIRQGRSLGAGKLPAALDGQAATRRSLHTMMDDVGFDLWVAPSSIGPAPAGLASTGDPVMNLPWTQVGLPALSLPCGVEPDGLPLGLQLVARWYDDERLLSWAGRIERALGLAIALGVTQAPSTRSVSA